VADREEVERRRLKEKEKVLVRKGKEKRVYGIG
jgi:hypothetical protein